MMREGCNADAILGGRTSNNTDAKGAAYRCSNGSGRAMCNSIGCSSTEDVGQESQASTQVSVQDDQSDAQLWSITGAHSSLRGNVDLG